MEQIPTLVSNAIINLSDNKIVLLLAINVLLLIVGMFMETLSAMIVLTPLLLAIVTPLGYNPIQFGVMMTINLAIGQCTPPVGTSLFIATRIAGIRIDQSLKWFLHMHWCFTDPFADGYIYSTDYTLFAFKRIAMT